MDTGDARRAGGDRGDGGVGGDDPTPAAGRVALVTGGGSGIGRASADLLARAGASVVVVDVDGAAARDTVGSLAGAGSGPGLAVEADVSDPEAWDRIAGMVADRFGGLWGAHLNAGVVTGEVDITALTDEQFQRAVGVNVGGVVFGIRALAPLIAGTAPPGAGPAAGGIVATSSLAGLIGYSPDPVYALTKHAVIGLVRALAPQLTALGGGVTINAVCPGLVDTPLLDDGMRASLDGTGFPLIDPEVVAAAVLRCLLDGETGRAMVVQAGREPVAFRFGRPPGPRAEGSVGAVPPSDLAAHDQG